MRLGLDMGTNSIGWWLFHSNNGDIDKTIDAGVVLFDDGRTPKKETKAKARRIARQIRRQRDRYLQRRKKLVHRLTNARLLPKDEREQINLLKENPYKLRKKGLDEKLTLLELGRALFHINQRRGFNVQTIIDGDDENDEQSKKLVNSAITRLDEEMLKNTARTYGEYLYKISGLGYDKDGKRNHSDISLRVRVTERKDDKDKVEKFYQSYPSRETMRHEFDALFKAQCAYHPELTDALRRDIYETIFWQRGLKPQKKGRCIFEKEEIRLSAWHPLFQERRLLETLNKLKITEVGKGTRSITLDERNRLYTLLSNKKDVTFKKIRTELNLNDDFTFNLETKNCSKILGNEVRAFMNQEKYYNGQWGNIPCDDQVAILTLLMDHYDPKDPTIDPKAPTILERDNLIEKLGEYGMEKELAEKLLDNIALKKITGQIGLTATKKIIDALEKDVITYDKAVDQAGYSHSDFRTGEVFENLRYYGEILPHRVMLGDDSKDAKKDPGAHFGKIGNPTVHIALNQLRRLVNKIISVYGLPDEIVVELGRDLKNSKKVKKRIDDENNKNKKAAEERSKKLTECGFKDTGSNRNRLRIWEHSNEKDINGRVCLYCGTPIGYRMALNEKDTQIDHIIPYSISYDDGIMNKTLCCTSCNQEKGQKTPAEAWAHTDRWEKIKSRIQYIPKMQRDKFALDARAKIESDPEFLARQLTDMQYISKIAREYLSTLYPDMGEGSSKVWVLPGRMTEMLRRHWGLNKLLSDKDTAMKEKNRTDHRHHAIDAFVIGATSRSLLQGIQKASAQNEKQLKKRVISVPDPYDGFCDDVKKQLAKIMPYHRPDHGKISKGQTTGQLHNETAYGVIKYNADKRSEVVVRKPIAYNNVHKIRDGALSKVLLKIKEGKTETEFKRALEEFSKTSNVYKGIKSARIKENITIIPQYDKKTGKILKAFKGDSNHCVEIWQLNDGNYKSFVLSTYDANIKGLGSTRPHPTAKLHMRLYPNDYIMADKFKDRVMRLVIISKDIYFIAPNEANVDARTRSKDDSLKYETISVNVLMKNNIRKVGVDILGRIKK